MATFRIVLRCVGKEKLAVKKKKKKKLRERKKSGDRLWSDLPSPASIAAREEELENRDRVSKNHLWERKKKNQKTATACCSIFGRLGDCLLKYCPVAVGLERGTEWQ